MHNMLLAIHMCGTAETLAMGVKNGLDPIILSEIMKNSSGSNWSLKSTTLSPMSWKGLLQVIIIMVVS